MKCQIGSLLVKLTHLEAGYLLSTNTLFECSRFSFAKISRRAFWKINFSFEALEFIHFDRFSEFFRHHEKRKQLKAYKATGYEIKIEHGSKTNHLSTLNRTLVYFLSTKMRGDNAAASCHVTKAITFIIAVNEKTHGFLTHNYAFSLKKLSKFSIYLKKRPIINVISIQAYQL